MGQLAVFSIIGLLFVVFYTIIRNIARKNHKYNTRKVFTDDVSCEECCSSCCCKEKEK